MSLRDVQRVYEGKSELSWSEIEGSLRQVTTALHLGRRIVMNSVAKCLMIIQNLGASEQSTLRLTLSLTRRGTKAELKAQLYTARMSPAESAPSSSSKRGSGRSSTTSHTD